LKVKKSVFIDKNRKILLDDNADESLQNTNDLEYMTSSGIIEVNPSRWKDAQKYERTSRMSEDGLKAKEDRNKFHEINFDNYLNIKGRKFKNVIEIGCGPFTNIVRILNHVSCEKVTLLDPLIADYLKHPHCAYKNNMIKYGKFWSMSKKEVTTISEPIEDFLPNETYDLVVLINVLEHCFSLEKVLNKILSLSSKNGVLIFHDKLIPNDDLKEIVTRIYDAGHPLRISQEEIQKFLNLNYNELFSRNVEIPIKDIYTFNSVYFIGELRPTRA